MVSLQIIYISPLLLCSPQAHKASFSMLLLANGAGETSSEVCCGWSQGVRTDARRRTRTAFCALSTESTTKLLFLPEQYMCSFRLQLNKSCRGITHLGCLRFPWGLSSGSGVSGECLCLSNTFQSVSVMDNCNCLVTVKYEQVVPFCVW